MKFKHLVAFVTVNASNKATKNVSLNGGSVAIGGILPVTVGVGDDGYTQTPVRGALTTTETTVTVGAAGVDGSTKTWIPVVAGFSFADGVALSYLDGSDGVIGQATLKKATSVDLGAELTFPSTINEVFQRLLCDGFRSGKQRRLLLGKCLGLCRDENLCGGWYNL